MSREHSTSVGPMKQVLALPGIEEKWDSEAVERLALEPLEAR